MKNINVFLHKNHKLIGIIFALPIFLTALTGVLAMIADEFLHNEGLEDFFLGIHTMKIIGLEEIYPIFVGISLIWLMISGVWMYKKPNEKKNLSQLFE